MADKRMLVELASSSEPFRIIQVLTATPTGLTFEEVAKRADLTVPQVRWWAGKLKKLFVNVNAAKRGDSMKLSMRDVTPEVSVVATTVEKAKGGNGNSGSSSPRSAGTDVVVPPAPDIPDVKEKYWYFTPPDWHAHMKSKVLAHHRNIRLAGPPGVGKSVGFEYLAATEFVPLVNINADAGLRARQLIGGMTDVGRFEMSQFAAAVINGWWAKIDEINGADPDALLFLNGLLAAPYQITVHGKTYPVHDQFRLCITYNPGLVGTKPLPDSLKDRLYPFSVQFPTEARLRKMLSANNVDPDDSRVKQMIAFALQVAKERRDGPRKHKYDITIRRLLDAWTDIHDGLSVRDALINSCIAGIDNDIDAKSIMSILDETMKGGSPS